MSDPERKHASKLPDAFREVDGFGKPEAKHGPSSQRDSGTVPPVEPAPEARALKRCDRERKRHESVTRRKVNKYRQRHQRLGKRL